MPETHLRRASLADAERLTQLACETFRETFLEGFAIPYPPEDLASFMVENYTREVFERKLGDQLQATWIAERDGEPLAYANAGPCRLPHADVRPDDVELNRLYVLRSAQGLGLGRALLETALAWMEAQGPGPLWLGVWSGNLKAQALYARYGFRKVGDYRFPVGTWRDDEFILKRGV